MTLHSRLYTFGKNENLKNKSTVLRFHDWQNGDIERFLSISRKERKKKIIAPHSVSEAFYLVAKWLTELLCLHTDAHTRSLIALEASFRRVFFPQLRYDRGYLLAPVCAFVTSVCVPVVGLPPTFDFVSSSYDSKSPQVRLRRHM